MAFTETYGVELGSGAEDSITGTVTRHFQGMGEQRGHRQICDSDS